MTYLNTHARTTSATANDTFKPTGRMPALQGVFVGFIKDASDVQRNGRLKVWIPEFGSAPDNEDGWIIVNYCSPFAGATNVETISQSNLQTFEGTQTSYGMWMIPPDINNQVLIMFVNGDPSRGIWIGSLYNQFMNQMVPAMSADVKNWQYPGKFVPTAEYNKWDTKVTQPDRAFKPYEATKFKGLGNQGLITDKARGPSSTSARRESPSNVFGIITPGPVVDANVSVDKIRRKGGSSFIMDDGTGTEYVQLTTKSGAQIRLDETNGFVYLINRDGTGWVQMDQLGNIDIFGAGDISLRAQRDVNIRGDRNVNIEAGQNLFMKAAKDTKQGTTSFTYDVNNVPKVKTITSYDYVGEGQGTGGNIVMQALNNWQSTTKNSAYLTVIDNNMQIKVNNNFNVTTVSGGQNFNSKQGIAMTSQASFDLATVGNIRIGTQAELSVVSVADTIMCSGANTTIKATDTINLVAGTSILAMAVDFGITANTEITGLTSITGATLISGGLGVTGDMALSGSLGGGSSGTSTVTFQGSLNIDGTLNVSGNAAFNHVTSASGSSGAAPTVPPPTAPIAPTPATEPNPPSAQAAMAAAKAAPAEIKPLNDKINILPTWVDPNSKFKRNSQSLQTTVSRLPTFEPCPEHETFTFASITGYTPKSTPDAVTYEGSGGAGNEAKVAPAPAANPGANNTSVAGDPPADSAVAKDFNMAAYQCQLKIHEGVKYVSYLDSVGLPTAGIGHLLRSNEVSQYPIPTPVDASQVDSWFQQDAPISITGAQQLLTIDTWGDLTDVRKRACADLCYNLGKTRLSKFVNFLAAMKAGDYNKAGQSLRDSKWFTQVGKRGPNIVTMIVQNVDPNGCDKKFPG